MVTRLSSSLLVVLCSLPLIAAGCGDDGGGGGGDGGILVDGDGTPIDGDGTPIPPAVDFDGGPINGGADCSPESTQCNNCIDDDEDGAIDGNDFECISPLDDDEGSFATGIPGDNKDFKKQDCFFDGDSGAGNDGCDVHVCCYLNECDDNNFDSNTDCVISTQCKNNCGSLTPPGCDCFGCCTLCDETGCYTVAVNPAVSPECDETVISDPEKCLPCTKVAECGPSVDCSEPDDCILCPGEPEENLPSTCGGMEECPDGKELCEANSDCPENEYCSQGCCNEGFIIE